MTRIDYFKCSDFDEMYFTFGQPNSYGGLACETTIVSLTHLDSFQIAYSLVKRLGCKYEPIVDGAVFVLATGGNRGNAADSTVKRLAQTDSLISLVMDYDLISGNRNMKKQFLKQWRSFCHYLVLEYSLEAFLTLIRNSSNLGFLLQEARSIYKKDLMALQREWIESLGLE
ncbi:hypothetical protein IBX73_10065 [candidate division WOR-3 bacterium]|nr:hypothetical protein [candidate division WOR-3 bacterium]